MSKISYIEWEAVIFRTAMACLGSWGNFTGLIHLRSLDAIESIVGNSKHEKISHQERYHKFSGVDVSKYVMSLVEARRCKDLPVFDFSHLQTFIIKVANKSDREAVNTLIKVTEILEYLHYEVNDFAGLTVIEEIDLDATVNTSDELGKLDSVLATGFPFLKRVTHRRHHTGGTASIDIDKFERNNYRQGVTRSEDEGKVGRQSVPPSKDEGRESRMCLR
ncbi:hypothetical protein BDQ12DRAFT_669602 [Crucibulum laeve]|uniref:Uncharacterized protein n=1 Tax=Crucibulum laeve TaxID=68775 RepID=A0A5C3LQA6_9AGAR|nr:hypothetical protein BDQ12DRAFT_669602 [Crucibulum laeve]